MTGQLKKVLEEVPGESLLSVKRIELCEKVTQKMLTSSYRDVLKLSQPCIEACENVLLHMTAAGELVLP